MLENIAEIVKDLLITEAEITEATSFNDDLGADSLDIFELVMALEEEFGVEIPSEDLENVNTVADVINYLKAHDVAE